jgi:aerobic carbon-monoxide dehydrogenase small subunit
MSENPMHLLRFELNGDDVCVAVPPWARLLDVLRGPCGQTGTKEGCGEGECGACSVFVDGRMINSCLYPALDAEGCTVTTIEGLHDGVGGPSALQRTFVSVGGTQCGFCTPGMIVAAEALLSKHPDPDPEEIRQALRGNLCRCTGYVQIIESIQVAASLRREGADAARADGEQRP